MPASPSIPAHFPDLLAPRDDEGPWGPNVHKAYTIISDMFSRATALLRQEDGDALRLRIHLERFLQWTIPLLEATEPEIQNPNWIAECAHGLAAVMVTLKTSAFAADGA
jgi:hypothetical protein